MTRRLADGRARRDWRRDERGSVLVVVLLLVAALAALTPALLGPVRDNTAIVLASTEQRAALEAADAGVQWFENHLDTDPAYSDNTATDASLADPAESGWCESGEIGCGLPSSTPEEAFHYASYAATGGQAGQLELEVTGRGGAAAPYAYETVLATFARNSILDNVYFSNYELLDPSVIRSYVNEAALKGSPTASDATAYEVDVNGTVTSVLNATVATSSGTEPLWNALCDYYTYQQNSFIDAIGSIGDGGGPYSATHSYFGPFEGSSLSFADGSEKITYPVPNASGGDLCGGDFDFITGESFGGPVYTEDQLHVCGDPSFNGVPVSLTSGAPADLDYGWDVPGSVEVTAKNSGPGETYPSPPSGAGTVYSPGGVIDDCASNPTYASGGDGGPALNGDEAMPQTNQSLLSLASAGGCVYEGPTEIELVTIDASTTMDVWSPLSSSTNSGCGVFSAASPYVTGIPLPADGVVYVESAPSSAGTTAPDCVDANAPDVASDDTGCTAGNAYVEGELAGQLTVAASGDILITRDLTYQCVDASESATGSANATDPSSVEACTDAAAPDVLGLDAGQDVILARYEAGLAGAASPPPYCTYDGTGAPPSGAASGMPNCEVRNPIVDAAVIATDGSFGVQSYDFGTADGNAQLNGADVSDYRGPFGTYSGASIETGYAKVFSFDARLAYLTPPGLLDITSADWRPLTVTSCGDAAALATTPALDCPGAAS